MVHLHAFELGQSGDMCKGHSYGRSDRSLSCITRIFADFAFCLEKGSSVHPNINREEGSFAAIRIASARSVRLAIVFSGTDVEIKKPKKTIKTRLRAFEHNIRQ
jgi:hypothetical protein